MPGMGYSTDFQHGFFSRVTWIPFTIGVLIKVLKKEVGFSV